MEILYQLSIYNYKYQAQHQKYWNDRTFLIKAFDVSTSAFDHIDTQFTNDKEIMLIAVRRCGMSLKYLHQDLQKDEDIVRVAIGENALSLQYAHISMQNKKHIVLLAIKSFKQSLKNKKYGSQVSDDQCAWILMCTNHNLIRNRLLNRISKTNKIFTDYKIKYFKIAHFVDIIDSF